MAMQCPLSLYHKENIIYFRNDVEFCYTHTKKEESDVVIYVTHYVCKSTRINGHAASERLYMYVYDNVVENLRINYIL